MNRYKVIYMDCGEEHSCTIHGDMARDAEENFWDWIDSEFGGPEGINVVAVIKIK